MLSDHQNKSYGHVLWALLYSCQSRKLSKAAAGVLLEEKKDQTWLKAFFKSKRNRGPVAEICYTMVNLSATTFLCRVVLWKGANMIVQLQTLKQSLYEEVK